MILPLFFFCFPLAIKEKYETYDQLQKKALDAGQENASRRRRLDTHAAEQRKLFEGKIFWNYLFFFLNIFD